MQMGIVCSIQSDTFNPVLYYLLLRCYWLMHKESRQGIQEKHGVNSRLKAPNTIC